MGRAVHLSSREITVTFSIGERGPRMALQQSDNEYCSALPN